MWTEPAYSLCRTSSPPVPEAAAGGVNLQVRVRAELVCECNICMHRSMTRDLIDFIRIGNRPAHRIVADQLRGHLTHAQARQLAQIGPPEESAQ
jgi:hypothetical protein